MLTIDDLHLTSFQKRLLTELNLLDKIEKLLQNSTEKNGENVEIANIKIEIIKLIDIEIAKLKLVKNALPKYDAEIIKWRKSLNLLTDKPILRLANIITDGQNQAYNSDFELDILLEKEALEMSVDERLEFGLSAQTGLDKMIQACYSSLNLQTYLTTGVIETRAWTFKKGWTAPRCAGVIHTDFAKKFVKAEVIKYEDFVAFGSRKAALESGKVRIEGKDYTMKDGDVVEFKIGN